MELPTTSKSALQGAGFDIVEQKQPSFLLDGSVLVTGEVDHPTEFERGFPVHEAHRDGTWQPDPLILDDQALVASVRGHGLVVLTGCGHSGIVNILRYVRKLTGQDDVHAVVGGFHRAAALSSRSSSRRAPRWRSSTRTTSSRRTAPGGGRLMRLRRASPTRSSRTASAHGSTSRSPRRPERRAKRPAHAAAPGGGDRGDLLPWARRRSGEVLEHAGRGYRAQGKHRGRRGADLNAARHTRIGWLLKRQPRRNR